jgi:two-component system C4-dicarboxylate transport response regulator DctD
MYDTGEISMPEHVLLIDDEKDIREIITMRMKLRQMKVTACATAEEAMPKIESEHFDAIILDIMLPGIDGIRALKTILNNKPDSLVILLTGYATIEMCVEAMKLGAADFIEKPFDIDILCEKIKEAQSRKMKPGPGKISAPP